MPVDVAHQPLLILLRRLWPHISRRRRKQLAGLAVLMVVSTLAEVISIGAVFPFLGALTAPNQMFDRTWTRPITGALGVTSPSEWLLALTVMFGLAAVISAVARVALLWAQTTLGNAIGVDLGSEAFRRTLYQPYPVHAMRNSSDVVAAHVTKVNTVVYFVIIPALTAAISVFMVMVLVTLMFWVEPSITVAVFLGLGSLYVILAQVTKKRVAKASHRVTVGQSYVTRVVQESLGGIRDVLIEGAQEAYSQTYRQADHQVRRALGTIAILSGTPRPIVEALGVLLIGGAAYVLANRPEGLVTAIPMLGALALAAQRLVPIVQQGYASWTSIHGGKASLADILALLEQPLPAHANVPPPNPMAFQQGISLRNVHFRYSEEGPWILGGVDLKIPRGSRVGLIGTTGSGKSTLLDIVMGLLVPTTGTLNVDDTVVSAVNHRAWQAHIAHVPQALFLADTTIAENIAFAVPPAQIDIARVKAAAQRAQIAFTIESWSEGYDTLVGERGVRLSGGQRQRIGIARALYKQADVLVLDEATSALDTDTEEAVTSALKGLDSDLTIFIVAHRLSTLRNCSLVVELADGRVASAGSYDSMVMRPRSGASETNLGG